MATVKIQCPKCLGTGLTGSVSLVICSECTGVGTISVADTDTLATINAASAVPLVETAPAAQTAAQLSLESIAL